MGAICGSYFLGHILISTAKPDMHGRLLREEKYFCQICEKSECKSTDYDRMADLLRTYSPLCARCAPRVGFSRGRRCEKHRNLHARRQSLRETATSGGVYEVMLEDLVAVVYESDATSLSSDTCPR